MRIASAHLVPYRLPLKRPWVAASETLTERQGALVRLTAQDGIAGWGDCAPLPSSGAVGQARVFAALDACLRRCVAAGSADDDGSSPPEVRWAIETALLDIEAQRRGVLLACLLGANAGATTLAVNAALGPLDAACAVRAAQAAEQGFAIGKIKVGIDTPDNEIECLRALVVATRGRLRLRLDANRAWSEAEAQRFLASIAELPIDAVEEPLAAPSVCALAGLQAALPFAIAVDESLPLLDMAALIETKAVRRFVLKPARLGGYAATRAIAQRAVEAGIEIVLTSVIDSAIGIIATAHLAAALAPAIAHGLGTSAWLAADVADAPLIANGRMTLPAGAGLGVAPSESQAPSAGYSHAADSCLA
ncbi:MAG: o-succinylbenzoate synthase [Sterolibacterium sp.]